jgi:peptidyl-prolyl cis-trans isomerase C
MLRLPSLSRSLGFRLRCSVMVSSLLAAGLTLSVTAFAADASKQPAGTSKSSAAPAKPAATPAPAADPNDPVVIRINGGETVIHRSDVVALQKSLGPQVASLPLDQFYQKAADRLIAVNLLGDAAKQAKLDAEPGVKKELENAKENILANAYVAHLQESGATDDQLKALYDKTIKDEPGKPEVHARHILVKTEEEAKAIIAELDKGGDFAKLADEKTTDKGGNGGDLGWFNKDQMVPEFSEAAFKLAKGEYTKEPVKTQFGWHVIKVEDTRISSPPTFDEVKDKLKSQLAVSLFQDKLKELKAKAKIEQFALDGSPLPPPAPPAPAPAPGAAPAPAPAAPGAPAK